MIENLNNLANIFTINHNVTQKKLCCFFSALQMLKIKDTIYQIEFVHL